MVGGGELDQEHRVHLHRFAYVLQRFHDDMWPSGGLVHSMLEVHGRDPVQNSRYQSAFLIKCLLTCQFLRDSSKLKQVVTHAINLCLPRSVATLFSEMLSHRAGRGRRGIDFPSASKISASRLLLDVAFMHHMRKTNAEALQAGGSVRYMLADSSVQGHRDFELVRMHSISKSRLFALLIDAHNLYDIWRGVPYPAQDFMDDWLQQQDIDWINNITAGIIVHAMPVAVIGSARGSLRHKFHAVMHSMFLESACAGDLSAMSAEICTFTTDQGVEFGFHRIEKVPMQQLFPWAMIPNAVQQDVDFEFAPPWQHEVAEHLDHDVDVSKAVGIAGLLHIIHNTSDDLGSAMHVFDDVIHQASHICTMIRKETSRDRLFESCFSSAIGRHLRSDFKGFNAKVHKARWGTIAHAVLQLVEVEHALRYCWDKGSYGAANRRDEESDKQYGVDLEIVDQGIASPFVWACLKMLKTFSSLILQCFAWAEGCRCHSHYPRHDVPKHVLHRWDSCPMRGRRAPCLAAGQFMNNLAEIVAQSAAEVVAALPNDISQDERGLLLQDFERGRLHLVFAFSLRLAHWRAAPWSIYACAHADQPLARRHTRLCLDVVSDHHLFRRLQTDPVKNEALLFVGGQDLAGLRNLAELFGELYFACTAERSVEGDHAQVLTDIRKHIVHQVMHTHKHAFSIIWCFVQASRRDINEQSCSSCDLVEI